MEANTVSAVDVEIVTTSSTNDNNVNIPEAHSKAKKPKRIQTKKDTHSTPIISNKNKLAIDLAVKPTKVILSNNVDKLVDMDIWNSTPFGKYGKCSMLYFY